jgi:hypothetical protein
MKEQEHRITLILRGDKSEDRMDSAIWVAYELANQVWNAPSDEAANAVANEAVSAVMHLSAEPLKPTVFLSSEGTGLVGPEKSAL